MNSENSEEKLPEERDRAISNTLKQVHKPWHQRSTDDVEEHSEQFYLISHRIKESR